MIFGDGDGGVLLIAVEDIKAAEILDVSGRTKAISGLLEISLCAFDGEGCLWGDNFDIVGEIFSGDIEVDAAVVKTKGCDIDTAVVECLEERDFSKAVDGNDLPLTDSQDDGRTETGLEFGRFGESHADGRRCPLLIWPCANSDDPLRTNDGGKIGPGLVILKRLGRTSLFGDDSGGSGGLGLWLRGLSEGDIQQPERE